MITVIEVKKSANENNVNLVRRFTRKVQESGIIQKVKSKRYNQRSESKLKNKSCNFKKISSKERTSQTF
jgi:ribosomal protein S21